MARTSPIYYIAPTAVSISPNANGSQNDLEVYISENTVIKVYSPAIQTLDAVDGKYQEWALTGRNRRLADSSVPYTIFARLPKTDKSRGYLVFAPQSWINGAWIDKYSHVIKTGSGLSTPSYDTDDDNWYIRLGDVSLPSSGQRTVTFDSGILGTEQYNSLMDYESATAQADLSEELARKKDRVVSTYSFSDVIALTADESANTTQGNGTFYFLLLKPENYNNPLRVRLRVTTEVVADTEYLTDSYIDLTIIRSTLSTWSTDTAVRDASHKPIGYYTLYTAKTSSVAEETGHLFGISLLDATNPRNGGLKRSGTVDLIEISGGSYSWIRTPSLFANLTVTGSANYDILTNLDSSKEGFHAEGIDYSAVETGVLRSAVVSETCKFVLDPNETTYRFVVLNDSDETLFSSGDITGITTAAGLAAAIKAVDGYDNFAKQYGLFSLEGTVEEDLDVYVGEDLEVFETAQVLTAKFWEMGGGTGTGFPSSISLTKGVSHVNAYYPYGYSDPKQNYGTEFYKYAPGHNFYPVDRRRTEKVLYISIPVDQNGFLDPTGDYTLYTWNGTEYVPLGSNVEVDTTPQQNGTNAISSGWAYTAEQAIEGNNIVHNATSGTSGTAAVTTKNHYNAAIWRVDLSDEVTELYTGLTVLFKVPVAGNGTYGTLLRIDGTTAADDSSTNLYPVCANVNTMISTRYAVGCIIALTFDADQVGQTLYYSGASYTTIANGSGWAKKGCWKIADYDSNTTTTYGTLDYYFRPYTAARLTHYKVVALDKDNRVIPITTEQYCGTYSSSTSYAVDDIVSYKVDSTTYYYKCIAAGSNHTPSTATSYWQQYTMPSQFTPTQTPFRPEKLRFYNSSTLLASGVATGGQTLIEIGYSTAVCGYTFWASIPKYNVIYLQGTYDKATGLFTLDSGANYYKLVPDNTANLTLSSYFTSGKYYILLGATYSTDNYFQLFMVNTMYYFDGTNLIPFETKVAKDEANAAKEYANTAHHITILPQDNVEIAETVRRYWELYLSNIDVVGLPRQFTVAEMGYIGFTSDVLSGILSRRYLRISEMYGEEQTIETSNYTRTYEVVDVRMNLAANEEDYYMYFSLRYEGKYYWDFVGFDDEGEVRWTLSRRTLTTTVDSALDSTSENPVQNKIITAVLTALQGRFDNQGRAREAVTAGTAALAERALTADAATTATNLTTAPSASVHTDGKAIKLTVGGKTSNPFTVPYATNARNDEDDNRIKTTYLKINDAKFVSWYEAQNIGAVNKEIARNNIDSENLVIGYYTSGFTTNIYFTSLEATSPRSGSVYVFRNNHNLLWQIDYTNLSADSVLPYIASYINNIAGYSATCDQNPPTQAYQAIITITGTGVPVEDLQFQSGFVNYTFTVDVDGGAAGFYADANFETLVTNTYVARKLYLDLGHNALYCGNENELQPVTGSPIVNATYDSASGNVTLWFDANTSLTIPLAGIIPTYTAGKGIDINGGEIAQNYVVCTVDELEDYLALGIDDGLIRYVYEEE